MSPAVVCQFDSEADAFSGSRAPGHVESRLSPVVPNHRICSENKQTSTCKEVCVCVCE